MKPLALQSLDIADYRGLGGMKLEEFGRINLFVGGNNSGKTSLLEALALFARPLDIENWVNTAWRREIKSSRIPVAQTLKWMFPKLADSSRASGRIRIAGEGHFDGKELSAEYVEEQVISGDGGGANSQGASSEGIIQRILNLKLCSKHVQQPLRGQPQAAGAPLVEKSLPFRISRNDQLRFHSGVPGVALPLEVIDASAHRVEATVQDLYSEALGREAKNQDLKQEFIRILQKIDPGVQRLELVQAGRVATRLQIKHERTGVTPLSALGDGFRRALMIAVTIPTVRGGILLIDELEAALHVSVLHSVLGLLKWAAEEFDVQVFATTHSLEAVDGVIRAFKDTPSSVVGYRLERSQEQASAKRSSGETLRELRFDMGLEFR